MFSGSKTKSGAVVLHQTFPPECHIPARREGRSQNRRGAYYTRLGYEIPSWLELEGGESPALVFFFFFLINMTPPSPTALMAAVAGTNCWPVLGIIVLYVWSVYIVFHNSCW